MERKKWMPATLAVIALMVLLLFGAIAQNGGSKTAITQGTDSESATVQDVRSEGAADQNTETKQAINRDAGKENAAPKEESPDEVASYLMSIRSATDGLFSVAADNEHLIIDNTRALTSGERTDMTAALTHLLDSGRTSDGELQMTRDTVLYFGAGDIQGMGSGDITFDVAASAGRATELRDGLCVYMMHIHDGRADYAVDHMENGEVTFAFDGFSPVAIVVTTFGANDAPDCDLSSWQIPDASPEDR